MAFVDHLTLPVEDPLSDGFTVEMVVAPENVPQE
jgi:hypothetical protein